jgi:hypothetical protein
LALFGWPSGQYWTLLKLRGGLFLLVVLGLNLLLLLWLLCWLGRGRCSVLLFRKVYPALRYLKHDRPRLCVLNSLGGVQALLGMLPIFFRLAHHGDPLVGMLSDEHSNQ